MGNEVSGRYHLLRTEGEMERGSNREYPMRIGIAVKTRGDFQHRWILSPGPIPVPLVHNRLGAINVGLCLKPISPGKNLHGISAPEAVFERSGRGFR